MFNSVFMLLINSILNIFQNILLIRGLKLIIYIYITDTVNIILFKICILIALFKLMYLVTFKSVGVVHMLYTRIL